MGLDNRYNKLVKNTTIVFIGNVSSKLITFLMLPFYTSYLSTVEYGESDLIHTYATILLSFITCCVGDAIFIFPQKEDNQGKTRFFTSGLIFALVMFIVWSLILFLSSQILTLYKVQNTFTNDLWWIIGLTFSTFFQYYIQQFTMCTGKMIFYSLTGLVNTALIALFAFLLLPKWGLNGYLMSLILANLCSTLFNIIVSRLFCYFNIHSFDFSSLKQLLVYGIPLIPNTIMWWLVNGLNRPIMEAELGLSAIGIFAVANKFPSVIAMIFSVFSSAWNLSVLEEFESKDFNSYFNKVFDLVVGLALIVGIGISIFSKPIVRIFADDAFFDAWKFIPVLVLGVIFQCSASLVGSIFSAEKKSKYFFYSSIWGAVSSVIFTVIGIKILGTMGAAIAIALSFAVIMVVRIYYAWRHIDKMRPIKILYMFILYTIGAIFIIWDYNIWIMLSASLLVLMLMLFHYRIQIDSIVSIIKKKIA